MAGHVERMEVMRNAYKISIGKPEVKRPLERPRCRLEDNINMNLKEIGCKEVDRIHPAL
jgi:hypothetical protein